VFFLLHPHYQEEKIYTHTISRPFSPVFNPKKDRFHLSFPPDLEEITNPKVKKAKKWALLKF